MKRAALASVALALLPSVQAGAGPKGALEGERFGFHAADAFRLASGRCSDCPTPRQALWYFQEDLVAVPNRGPASTASEALPSLVWVGSPELLEHARLSDGGDALQADGRSYPMSLVPKLATNRSYYDATSAAFFQGRPLRVRGRTVRRDESDVFEARTIWPEDLRLDDSLPVQALGAESLASLIVAEPAGQRVLWRRDGQATFAGRPALAFVLSGAQGDDDEAHAGHFAVATGLVGQSGEWADWIANNFYNLDSVSEKGIVGAMVPMDNYLMDLNSGQAYYRPNYVLALVLRDGQAARRYQSAVMDVYDRYYRHDLLYDHSSANCTGISLDTLRRATGWNVPRRGPTGYAKAVAGFFYMLSTERSVSSGESTFDYLIEEQTRLLPRAAFESLGEDMLRQLAGRPGRALTPDETALRDDVQALVLLRLPQLPSSRALGSPPIASFAEYQSRVPSDRSRWKIVPVAPRPFPDSLRDGPAPEPRRSRAVPVATLAALALALGVGTTARLARRRLAGRLNRS